ncbi:hypothetical protein Tco_0655908 [Tanacetum coccineum]|uniref:Uncharacterized protein n=1 Tax=Tanacetum coccineum TaxID=301880 RepID=A0ABQ4X7B6_9ASTR
MENANPPLFNNRPLLPAALRVRINQELHELHVIPAFVASRLKSIKQFHNNFANQPNETNMNILESDNEAVDTPLVSPFPHSGDSDDEEVLNELSEYENAGTLHRERIINSTDGDGLAFECMIDGLEGTRRNLVSIVRDVYVFVGSFTYITDFVMLEDIGEFIMSNMAKVLMGRPLRKITKLKYDVVKGLYLMRRILEVLRKFHWMILGGRFNQLSHVSSPLLSKPGEY